MNATERRRPLAVGLQLPEVERVVRWPELRAMAERAEAVGFDSLWVGDHLLYRDPGEETKGPWEAWTTLAALAAVTRTVELGPLVAATSFHSPAMLAKKAATVDELSAGRLVVGLGAGWNEVEYRAFGFPYDRRVSRFEEAFTIVRRLLAGETVDFEGRYYRTEACELKPASLRPGGPPLMVGSMGPRMLGITLPHVQRWNAWYAWFGNTPQGLTPILRRVDEAAAAAGRDPAEITRTAAILVELPGGRGRAHGDEGRGETVPLRGSANDLAEALARFAEVGIAHVQLVVDPINIESIERCAEVLAVLDSP